MIYIFYSPEGSRHNTQYMDNKTKNTNAHIYIYAQTCTYSYYKSMSTKHIAIIATLMLVTYSQETCTRILRKFLVQETCIKFALC